MAGRGGRNLADVVPDRSGNLRLIQGRGATAVAP